MAITHNITIDQGANYKENFTINKLTDQELPFDAATNPYVPMDLTGYTFKLQVRKDFDSMDDAALLTFSTANNNFVATSEGLLSFICTANESKDLAFNGKQLNGVYDLEATDINNNVIRIIDGQFLIKKNITL